MSPLCVESSKNRKIYNDNYWIRPAEDNQSFFNLFKAQLLPFQEMRQKLRIVGYNHFQQIISQDGREKRMLKFAYCAIISTVVDPVLPMKMVLLLLLLGVCMAHAHLWISHPFTSIPRNTVPFFVHPFFA